jgi:hypothetical protein
MDLRRPAWLRGQQQRPVHGCGSDCDVRPVAACVQAARMLPQTQPATHLRSAHLHSNVMVAARAVQPVQQAEAAWPANGQQARQGQQGGRKGGRTPKDSKLPRRVVDQRSPIACVVLLCQSTGVSVRFVGAKGRGGRFSRFALSTRRRCGFWGARKAGEEKRREGRREGEWEASQTHRSTGAERIRVALGCPVDHCDRARSCAALLLVFSSRSRDGALCCLCCPC